MQDTGHLGIDINFDTDFNTDASGDTLLTDGLRCLAQDLKHALTTPKGDLWYDPSYGIDIYKYLKSEDSENLRLSLEQEITITMESDPRVVTGSARAKVIHWDLHSIKVEAYCIPITQSNRLNMVLNYSPNAFESEEAV